jgi:hypothetical protein
MSQSPPLSPCRASLAKRSHLIFALLISCVHVISLSLPVMLMVVIYGRSKHPMVGPRTGIRLRCRLQMKVFTSKVRCMPLYLSR